MSELADNLFVMAYTSEEGRMQLLDELGAAVDQVAIALAAAGEAYERLDEHTADALEQLLFRPLQGAYGRARRAHGEFASRYGLPARSFSEASSGPHSADPRVYLERAIEAAEHADQLIAELQDSMLPVEVGDRELRDALAQTREMISPVPERGRQLGRRLGR
jgi:hypothetical protein